MIINIKGRCRPDSTNWRAFEMENSWRTFICFCFVSNIQTLLIFQFVGVSPPAVDNFFT